MENAYEEKSEAKFGEKCVQKGRKEAAKAQNRSVVSKLDKSQSVTLQQPLCRQGIMSGGS